MLTRSTLIAVLSLAFAGTSAQAAIKFYDADANTGTPGDAFSNVAGACPPTESFLGGQQGYAELSDDGAGTVTLTEIINSEDGLTVIGADFLEPFFGPGAFIFIAVNQTRSIAAPHVSNSTGVGAHGPSGTDPGESVEWGLVTGWEVTGSQYCVASPTTICSGAGFEHGMTDAPSLESDTYNLGTWNFDSVGDMEAEDFYIVRTDVGPISNSGHLLRGALVGASLPALPLLGFGTLALCLAVVGGRSLIARK